MLSRAKSSAEVADFFAAAALLQAAYAAADQVQQYNQGLPRPFAYCGALEAPLVLAPQVDETGFVKLNIIDSETFTRRSLGAKLGKAFLMNEMDALQMAHDEQAYRSTEAARKAEEGRAEARRAKEELDAKLEQIQKRRTSGGRRATSPPMGSADDSVWGVSVVNPDTMDLLQQRMSATEARTAALKAEAEEKRAMVKQISQGAQKQLEGLQQRSADTEFALQELKTQQALLDRKAAEREQKRHAERLELEREQALYQQTLDEVEQMKSRASKAQASIASAKKETQLARARRELEERRAEERRVAANKRTEQQAEAKEQSAMAEAIAEARARKELQQTDTVRQKFIAFLHLTIADGPPGGPPVVLAFPSTYDNAPRNVRAALRMQRWIRRHWARKKAELKAKEDNWATMRETASILIARLSWGFLARKQSKSLKQMLVEGAASQRIQRIARGKIVRREMRGHFEERQKAARMLQRVQQGHQSRREVNMIRSNLWAELQRSHRLALRLQAVAHGAKVRIARKKELEAIELAEYYAWRKTAVATIPGDVAHGLTRMLAQQAKELIAAESAARSVVPSISAPSLALHSKSVLPPLAPGPQPQGAASVTTLARDVILRGEQRAGGHGSSLARARRLAAEVEAMQGRSDMPFLLKAQDRIDSYERDRQIRRDKNYQGLLSPPPPPKPSMTKPSMLVPTIPRATRFDDNPPQSGVNSGVNGLGGLGGRVGRVGRIAPIGALDVEARSRGAPRSLSKARRSPHPAVLAAGLPPSHSRPALELGAARRPGDTTISATHLGNRRCEPRLLSTTSLPAL